MNKKREQRFLHLPNHHFRNSKSEEFYFFLNVMVLIFLHNKIMSSEKISLYIQYLDTVLPVYDFKCPRVAMFVYYL